MIIILEELLSTEDNGVSGGKLVGGAPTGLIKDFFTYQHPNPAEEQREPFS